MEKGENKETDPFLKDFDESLKNKGFCLITLKKNDESSGTELIVNGKTFDSSAYKKLCTLLQSGNDVGGKIEEFLTKNVSGNGKRKYEVIGLNSGKKDTTKAYIAYDKNDCKIIEIKNIRDIIKDVQTREELFEKYCINLYFRGQKAHYDLLPSLFRNTGWVVHEAELNALIINDNPKEFLDCKSTFEKLVKLKHYNQPSRLLDITSNPLIALYFACDVDKDGGIPVVITAYSEKSKEKQSVSSDTVTMLTGLANSTIRSDLIQDLLKPIEDLPFCKDKDKNLCWRKYNCNITPERVVPRKNKESCYFSDDKQGNRYKKYEDKSVGEIIIGEIIHQCKKESGSELYWDDLCFNELNQCIVVNPPLNTDRIVRQKGCFIMCGLNPCDMFSPPESFYEFFKLKGKGLNAMKRHIYYVNPENISTIQSQLKMVGIDKYFVFPELENDIEEKKSNYENC